MAPTKDHLKSAINGCAKLSKVLECLTEKTCPHCGKVCELCNNDAIKLDDKVWTALRYAETLQ